MSKIPYRPKFIYCGMIIVAGILERGSAGILHPRHIDTKASRNISSHLHVKSSNILTIYIYLF